MIITVTMPKKVDLIGSACELPEIELPTVLDVLRYKKLLENLKTESHKIGRFFIFLF